MEVAAIEKYVRLVSCFNTRTWSLPSLRNVRFIFLTAFKLRNNGQ